MRWQWMLAMAAGLAACEGEPVVGNPTDVGSDMATDDRPTGDATIGDGAPGGDASTTGDGAPPDGDAMTDDLAIVDAPAGDAAAGDAAAGDAGDRCAAEATRICYAGPAGTIGVGRCRGGTQTCTPAGTWSACGGEVLPVDEVCGNMMDENCNGVSDEGCGECMAGATRPCYSGRPDTQARGAAARARRPAAPRGDGR